MFGGGNHGMNWGASGARVVDPGLGNLNNLGNETQQGISQQQAFLNAIASQGGLANQSSVFAQQQGLANQLGQMAQGGGPNPAQAMLAQQTGNNIAAQSALMAGQRGAGANAGLLARQAAQQGAATQQQAVGQGATLQAQQQLAAIGALQQQQGMMGSLANTQVGQQQTALNAYNQAAQSEQSILQNALAAYNNANVGMQSNINNANAGIQGQVAGAQGGLFGGLLGGAGALPMLFANKGGMIPKMADGGEVDQPQSKFGQFLKQWAGGNQAQAQQPQMFSGMAGDTQAGKAVYQGANQLSQGLLKAALTTKTPAANPMLGAGDFAEKLPGADLAMAASQGGEVDGQAKARGDSEKNDTVPAMLSPGEIVIPRSIINSKDPVKNAAKFVQAVMARHGHGLKK